MATTVSQAGSVQNVLNSPEYTRELQDYYLTTYAPGLTQATYGINSARNQFQANEGTRANQRGEAVRRIAGDYASRGLRSPGAINKDRSEVQNQFAALSREEQNSIANLENERDVLYGAGAQDGESFMNNPVLFGSVGAGARRSALSGLQNLPGQYGLLGMGPSRAPLEESGEGGSQSQSQSQSPFQAQTFQQPPPVTIASLLPARAGDARKAPPPSSRLTPRIPSRNSTARRMV
jgi:hypothetical protein